MDFPQLLTEAEVADWLGVPVEEGRSVGARWTGSSPRRGPKAANCSSIAGGSSVTALRWRPSRPSRQGIVAASDFEPSRP